MSIVVVLFFPALYEKIQSQFELADIILREKVLVHRYPMGF